jgi:enoyl-CoA hydratase/carnithine racemase
VSAERGVSLEVDGRVAVVTIDRPPANAINAAMAERLDAIWDEVEQRDVVALVLTSASERFFMAGGDIFDYARLDGEEMAALATKYRVLFRRLVQLPVISICVVDGLAVGGGAELALSCDLRIFGPSSSFSLAEVSLGGIPAAGGTQALLKLLGYATALDLMVTGRSLDQAEAARLELATPSDDPDKSARELAHHIASMPVESVRAIKRTLLAGAEHGTATGLEEEARSAAFLVAQDEFRERVQRFTTRRGERRAD